MRKLLTVVILGSALLVPHRADASCSPAQVQTLPAEGRPGDTIEVRGGGFTDRCNDVRSCHPDGTCEPIEPGRPRQNIKITLRMKEPVERTWRLTEVDAGSDFGFVTQVKIPLDAPPGSASVYHDRPNFTVLPSASTNTPALVLALSATALLAGAVLISRRQRT